MKFRFFKRENGLQSTRRRSASCPNLEQAGATEYIGEEMNEGDPSLVSSSDSGPEEKESASKFERLHAQRSIRRVRQKEKTKLDNAEKNLISMDDYLGKLTELKTWLREEKRKDPDVMKSPKLRAHFKTFVRLWNKRKLPVQYYRTLSVNLDAADCTLDLETEVIEEHVTPRYPLLDDPAATPSGEMSPFFPGPVMSLSPGNTLDDLGNGEVAAMPSVMDSPLFTFGKACGEYEALTSPAEVAKEMKFGDKGHFNLRTPDRGLRHKPNEMSSSSLQSSPTKFATISRSTPTSNTFKKPSSSYGQSNPSKLRPPPVLSPPVPPKPPPCQKDDATTPGKFIDRPLPETPAGSRTLPASFDPPDATEANSSADKDRLVVGWNSVSDQSPVYSYVMDAIPYSSDSPKYAEIDEAGVPRIIAGVGLESGQSESSQSGQDGSGGQRVTRGMTRITSSHQLDNDYCSLSPSNTISQTVAAFSERKKKSNLNRRRSKSMEDIYSMPVKTVSTLDRKKKGKLPMWEENGSKSPSKMEPPPIPERHFSPHVLFQSFLGIHKTRNAAVDKTQKTSSSERLPSPTLSPSHSGKAERERSPKKRRSEEGAESTLGNTSPKKTKAEDVLTASDPSKPQLVTSHNSESDKLASELSYDAANTPSKLSILTGSLKPTTRSANRLMASIHRFEEQDEDSTASVAKGQLGVMEVKQLEESPKFPRRRLKRRSSSLSVTPGKGLTFGKSSRMAVGTTPSPRRVSFAKDVKDSDTESQSTLRRRSSGRNALPVAGATVTRQTQESREFQTFLSSHASPPQKGRDSPTKMTCKPPSPIKTSFTNLLGALVKKTLGEAETNPPLPHNIENQKQVVGILKKGSACSQSLFNNQTSPDQSPGDSGKIFPPPPTRQLGRRALGSPIKKSGTANISGRSFLLVGRTVQKSNIASSGKESVVDKNVNPKPSLSPPKSLSTQASDLFPATKALGTNEEREIHGKSSFLRYTDMANGGLKSPHGFEPPTQSGAMSPPTQSEPMSPPTQRFTDKPLLRFDSTSISPEEFMPHLQVDHGFENASPTAKSRITDVKAFARVAKIWNRTVGFDASVEPFVRSSMRKGVGVPIVPRRSIRQKIKDQSCENRSNADKVVSSGSRIVKISPENESKPRCADEKSIMGQARLNSATGSNGHQYFDHTTPETFQITGQEESLIKRCVTPEETLPSNTYETQFSVEINPSAPVAENGAGPGCQAQTSIHSDGHGTSMYSFSETVDIGSDTVDRALSERAEPSKAADISFTLPPYPQQAPQSDLEEEILTTEEGPSFILPPYPDSENHAETSTNQEEASFVLPPYPEQSISGSYCEDEASFTLPPYPEPDLNLSNRRDSSKQERDSSVVSQCTEYDSTTAVGSETDKYLQRIDSLRRASPKVVKNDSWITARRRSSRRSGGHRSLRSTNSRNQLHTSITENVGSNADEISHDEMEKEMSENVANENSMEVKRCNTGRADVIVSNLPDIVNEDQSNQKLGIAIYNVVEECMEQSGKLNIPTEGITTYEPAVKKLLPKLEPLHKPSESSDYKSGKKPSPTKTDSVARVNKPSAPAVKPKPATLPKSSRAVTLAQKRLNVHNFVGSSSATTTSRPSPKRRSSLTKTQPRLSNPKPKENFIAKNIKALRSDCGERSESPARPTTTLTPVRAPTLIRKRSSVLNKATDIRVSNSTNRRRSKENVARSENVNPQPMSFTDDQSQVNCKAKIQTGARRSGANRRRSKSLGAADREEPQMSFAERRRFFQQLQSSKISSAVVQNRAAKPRDKVLTNVIPKLKSSETSIV